MNQYLQQTSKYFCEIENEIQTLLPIKNIQTLFLRQPHFCLFLFFHTFMIGLFWGHPSLPHVFHKHSEMKDRNRWKQRWYARFRDHRLQTETLSTTEEVFHGCQRHRNGSWWHLVIYRRGGWIGFRNDGEGHANRLKREDKWKRKVKWVWPTDDASRGKKSRELEQIEGKLVKTTKQSWH